MNLRRLKSLFVISAALLTASSVWAADEGQTLDVSQCETAWTSISPEDGPLSEEAAAKFVINITDVDSNDDGSISEVEFKEGCTEGQLRVAMDFPCCLGR
jgi:hypothetical protein